MAIFRLHYDSRWIGLIHVHWFWLDAHLPRYNNYTSRWTRFQPISHWVNMSYMDRVSPDQPANSRCQTSGLHCMVLSKAVVKQRMCKLIWSNSVRRICHKSILGAQNCKDKRSMRQTNNDLLRDLQMQTWCISWQKSMQLESFVNRKH